MAENQTKIISERRLSYVKTTLVHTIQLFIDTEGLKRPEKLFIAVFAKLINLIMFFLYTLIEILVFDQPWLLFL